MFRTLRSSIVVCSALLLGLVTQAQAQTPAAPATQSEVMTSAAPSTATLVSDPEYTLGDGDVIDLMVVGSADFNTRARVASDGAIVLPLIGPVVARGLTPSSLSKKVADALKKGAFFADPIVRVELSGIRSRYATVLGFVGTPGLIPLDRPYKLSEIMARVGGRGGGGASYVIVTSAEGVSKRFTLAGMSTGGGPDADPTIVTGDKIYVPPAEDEVIYLSGEIRNPGAMAASGYTVRIAVAKAGGISENGNEKKISIVRKGVKLKKATMETVLEPGDVVTIGARLF